MPCWVIQGSNFIKGFFWCLTAGDKPEWFIKVPEATALNSPRYIQPPCMLALPLPQHRPLILQNGDILHINVQKYLSANRAS